ncbi:hypothetical protein LCL89_10655 [Halobacillus yeomjeoni]|uniref:Uncharacterized protein n=1 Tax=Halobacillus yeomjeoni TaxID=311194 RepID=A0A931HX45_9BACI|nr:hypothetical protein [Halobacillus yeomjeoni]MBH0231053.1 hypothetical protein [Halobacillus yeomjeoni]MCA0984503.1 hypothetical protein [Halobacillus yeomjeoni]
MYTEENEACDRSEEKLRSWQRHIGKVVDVYSRCHVYRGKLEILTSEHAIMSVGERLISIDFSLIERVEDKKDTPK